MRQYLDLVRHVLETGVRKPNRTGVDTLSTFGHYYEADLDDGFPLLTTKAVSWKNIVVEMLWFLSGRTDIGILKRHGCKFWDSWADEHGEVPSAYGSYWRRFPTPMPSDLATKGLRANERVKSYSDEPVIFNDQIAWAVDTLRKDPTSRRVVVSAWAPGNAQTSKLPPCHAMFVCNVQNESVVTHEDVAAGNVPRSFYGGRFETTRQRLCLHLTQRSCDVALGVPYNLASYALLIHLLARFTGLEPGIFGHSLVDAHIYTSKSDGLQAEYDHVPGLREQLAREPRRLPRLRIDESIRSLADVERLMGAEVSTDEIMRLFVLEGYDPAPAIAFKVAV